MFGWVIPPARELNIILNVYMWYLSAEFQSIDRLDYKVLTWPAINITPYIDSQVTLWPRNCKAERCKTVWPTLIQSLVNGKLIISLSFNGQILKWSLAHLNVIAICARGVKVTETFISYSMILECLKPNNANNCQSGHPQWVECGKGPLGFGHSIPSEHHRVHSRVVWCFL